MLLVARSKRCLLERFVLLSEIENRTQRHWAGAKSDGRSVAARNGDSDQLTLNYEQSELGAMRAETKNTMSTHHICPYTWSSGTAALSRRSSSVLR